MRPRMMRKGVKAVNEKIRKALHDTDDLQSNPSKLHHRFSGLECEKEIKDKYEIDLRAEFPAREEVKP